MSLPVHLVPDLSGVGVGDRVEVTGDEAHHAVAVRRLKIGEAVLLTDGAGTAAEGEVAETGKRRLVVRVDRVAHTEAAQPSVTVLQAIPKGERGELAVEVLTEIGVDRIVPWAAARCVAQWKGERAAKSHAKWAATAREAAKQARRTTFPVVTEQVNTAAALALVEAAELAVVLHEEAALALTELSVPEAGEIVVVVGPEGGLAPEELAAFAAAGVTPVRLGSEVLRTSTAGVVAVAALLSRTARWG